MPTTSTQPTVISFEFEGAPHRVVSDDSGITLEVCRKDRLGDPSWHKITWPYMLEDFASAMLSGCLATEPQEQGACSKPGVIVYRGKGPDDKPNGCLVVELENSRQFELRRSYFHFGSAREPKVGDKVEVIFNGDGEVVYVRPDLAPSEDVEPEDGAASVAVLAPFPSCLSAPIEEMRRELCRLLLADRVPLTQEGLSQLYKAFAEAAPRVGAITTEVRAPMYWMRSPQCVAVANADGWSCALVLRDRVLHLTDLTQ